MDLLKAKINLDKINRAFTQLLKDPDNIPKIEVDIALSYVREFYDALQSNYPPPPAPLQAPVSRPVPAPPPAPAPAPTPTPVVAPPPLPVVEAPAPVAPIVPVAPAPAPVAPVRSSLPAEMEPLFEYKEAKELSEKLSESPIPDIKKALSLNDRLLIQRELFANDPAAFENALQQLNNLPGLEAAQQFLVQQCVYPYDWLNKNKIETAKWFIRMVRRRHK